MPTQLAQNLFSLKALTGGGYSSRQPLGGSGSAPGGGELTANLSGSLAHDSDLIIAGTGFGEKPAPAKPLAVWRADDGASTNLTLGREGFFDGAFNGSIASNVMGEGQSQSVEYDHGANSGSILPSFPIGTNRKKLVFRRLQAAYECHSDFGIRARIVNLVGDYPAPGQIVTGETTGIWGEVSNVDLGFHDAIFFKAGVGTIGDHLFDPEFEKGEMLTWEGGSASADEGIYRGLNNKVIRFYKASEGYTNIYVAEEEKAGYNSGYAHQTIEWSSGDSLESNNFTGSEYTRQSDYAYQWQNELWVVEESSGIGISDGFLNGWKSGDEIFPGADLPENRRVTKPAGYTDEPWVRVYMPQVSNGAQLGSKTYIDYVLTQDDWHWIQLRNSATGKVFVLPCKAWTDSKITVAYQAYFNEWDVLDVVQDGVVTHTYPRIAQ